MHCIFNCCIFLCIVPSCFTADIYFIRFFPIYVLLNLLIVLQFRTYHVHCTFSRTGNFSRSFSFRFIVKFIYFIAEVSGNSVVERIQDITMAVLESEECMERVACEVGGIVADAGISKKIFKWVIIFFKWVVQWSQILFFIRKSLQPDGANLWYFKLYLY